MSMREIGFWDYTCPRHGSLEYYRQDDWDRLLDDMSTGGFNSLVLGIKWLTTGYRSQYSWLDQDSENTAIASDNALIHYALDGARRRGIRTWLLVVASIFDVEKFGFAPATGMSGGVHGSASYDLDQPGVQERILMLFDEVTHLFGAKTDGIVVELEFCDADSPHRIPIYNSWAEQNGRPSFEEIKNISLEPRSYPFLDWRDFTTSRRIEVLRDIETTVRGAGFKGQIASLVELANAHMIVAGNVNLEMLKEALPHWGLVTYDSIYDRRVNRLATMDFCIEQPRQLGFDVFYLTRGVMTFGADWMPIAGSLREQWRMALEDAAQFKPDILWFMGSDARTDDGMVCNLARLPEWGFDDGLSARSHLLSMAKEMRLTSGA